MALLQTDQERGSSNVTRLLSYKRRPGAQCPHHHQRYKVTRATCHWMMHMPQAQRKVQACGSRTNTSSSDMQWSCRFTMTIQGIILSIAYAMAVFMIRSLYPDEREATLGKLTGILVRTGGPVFIGPLHSILVFTRQSAGECKSLVFKSLSEHSCTFA